MLRIPYLYALAAAVVNFAIVGFVQPISRYSYEALRYELRTGALGASIKVGEFNRLGPHTTLRIESSAHEGNDLGGLFVRSENPKGGAVTVTAARGRFLGTDDPDIILLKLGQGVLVQEAPGFSRPRVLSFGGHTIPIDLPRMGEFRKRGDKELEKTLPELLHIGADANLPMVARVGSLASTQRRLIQVVIMGVLPLLAVALAVPPKRSTSAVGVFLGIVLLVGFHKVTEYTERVGQAGRMDPLWGQWLPFAVFAIVSVWMYAVLAYKPGGQPIGAFERVARAVGGAFTKVFARRVRDPEPAGAAA